MITKQICDSKGRPLNIHDRVMFNGKRCVVLELTKENNIHIERCKDGLSWDHVQSKEVSFVYRPKKQKTN